VLSDRCDSVDFSTYQFFCRTGTPSMRLVGAGVREFFVQRSHESYARIINGVLGVRGA
jgi:hypothetical protein